MCRFPCRARARGLLSLAGGERRLRWAAFPSRTFPWRLVALRVVPRSGCEALPPHVRSRRCRGPVVGLLVAVFRPGPGLVLSPRAWALPVFLARLRMPISLSPFFYRARLRFLVSCHAFSGFRPPGWVTGSRCGAPANISRAFRFRLPFSPCSVPRLQSRHFPPFRFAVSLSPFRVAVLPQPLFGLRSSSLLH